MSPSPSPPPAPPLARALNAAIVRVREQLGDRLAPVVVVTPMRANAQLVERTLAARFPYLRVHFEPAAELVSELGRGALASDSRRTEPPGWLEATLLDAVPRLAAAGALGHHGAVVARPAWLPALAQALRALDGAGVDAASLRAATGDGVTERAALLAALVEHVAAARTADGLVAAGEIAARAREAAAAGRLPARLAGAGFVVLGDGALPYLTFRALEALFAARPTLRLALAPSERVPPAPNGLRLAVADADVTAVAGPAEGRLGHLQAHLFSAVAPSARCAVEADDSVVFAATPDEAREVTEAVRVVRRAIHAGTPLDRIAIAAPDAATADLLGDALDEAGVPATMLVGPPLARSPEARFLLLQLSLAGDEELATHWYEVLRHPGVRRTLERADVAVVGAGRWRRILASCGVGTGTARIAAAVRAWATRLDEDDARADDVAAATSLAAALDTYGGWLDGLPRRAPLGEHARAWRPLLAALPRSLGRGQLERVLDGLGAGGVGPAVTRREAMAILTTGLESNQVLRGSLKDRAVRVAPPMALLGGELDLVCVIGLNEGRFPRPVRQDALLSDALGDAVAAVLGEARLASAEHLRDAERRRFAAAIGAAGRGVWLSIPRSDLMSARPAVPSALALDALTALGGERATFEALRARAVRTGERDRFAPEAPADAVTPREHLIARLVAEGALDLHERRSGAEPATPGGGVRAAGSVQPGPSSTRSEARLDGGVLARHPWARHLLAMYRSIDRLYRPADGATPVFDDWSGAIPPELLPHPADGAQAVDPAVLAAAVATPAGYFFTHVLGAWRPRWFRAERDPAGRWNVSRWARHALVAGLDAGDDPMVRAAVELDALAAEAHAQLDGQDADRVRLARALAGANVDGVNAQWSPLSPGARRELVDAPIADDLPWRLTGRTAYVGGGALVDYDAQSLTGGTPHPEKYARLELEALALAHSGEAMGQPELRGVDGSSEKPRGWSAEDALRRAREAWRRVEAGLWPAAGSRHALHSERDALREGWLAAAVAAHVPEEPR